MNPPGPLPFVDPDPKWHIPRLLELQPVEDPARWKDVDED